MIGVQIWVGVGVVVLNLIDDTDQQLVIIIEQMMKFGISKYCQLHPPFTLSNNAFTALSYYVMLGFFSCLLTSRLSLIKSFYKQGYYDGCHQWSINCVSCGSYQDFLDRGFLLTKKLLNQGFPLVKLKSSLRKYYGHLHDLVDCYGISVSQMTMDMFHLL